MNLNNLRRSLDFQLWSQVHHLPPFLFKRWQFLQLKRVINLAYRRIPLYKKLWDEQGIQLNNVKSLEDIGILPIMKKQDFLQCPLEERMDVSFSLGRYIWKYTSGSTGEPFGFPISTQSILNNDIRYFGFNRYRSLIWQGFSIEYILKQLRFAQIRIHPYPTEQYLFIPISELRQTPNSVIDSLKKFNPDIIEGMATVLVELARIAESLPPETRPTPRFMFSYGEMLTLPMRAYITKIFNTEVYNNYGLEEVGIIGAECREHDDLHINEESAIIEIVDADGKSVPPATAGRIIVTTLCNDVAPFIRYDTGDEGMILYEPCSYGLSPKKLLVAGRGGVFITIGDKKIHHIEFDAIFRGLGAEILRYQVAKTSDSKMEIRVVPSTNFSPDTIGALDKQCYDTFGIKMDIKIVDTIPYTPRGKTQVVVDETKIFKHAA